VVRRRQLGRARRRVLGGGTLKARTCAVGISLRVWHVVVRNAGVLGLIGLDA